MTRPPFSVMPLFWALMVVCVVLLIFMLLVAVAT
jgi:hypothetical protein